MSDTSVKKYFLDLGGLQSLWNKMKLTFASKSDIEAVNTQTQNISQNLNILNSKIDGVEELTLLYAPKTTSKYSSALEIAKTIPAGTIIVVGSDEEIDGVIYNEGFYIVDNDKSIYYIGTSNGADDKDIADLKNRISKLEQQIIKTINIIDNNGNFLKGVTIDNNSLLLVYDNEVVANSESLNALTHRAISAKFGELEQLLTNIPKFGIEVVDELPTTNISHNIIYLVKNSIEDINNLYSEYIYIQNKGWEKLGDQKISFDNYVTKEFLSEILNTTLNNYVKKSELIDTKEQILSIVDENYVKKGETGFATEDSILKSIQTGKIGENITITNELINSLK